MYTNKEESKGSSEEYYGRHKEVLSVEEVVWAKFSHKVTL